MKAPGKDRCPAIRMFPDYADTVLWFGGPVDYDRAGLTQELVHDLRNWERSYYDSLTSGQEWKSTDLARRFTLEGNALAQRVADELGDGYQIVFRSYEQDAPSRRFRGTGPALNPRAAAAFAELAAVLRAEHDEVSQARAAARRGESPGWFACAPLSGTVFEPHRAGQEQQGKRTP